jgi:hypothetical protein
MAIYELSIRTKLVFLSGFREVAELQSSKVFIAVWSYWGKKKNLLVESKGFWRWCKTLTGFIEFSQYPEL